MDQDASAEPEPDPSGARDGQEPTTAAGVRHGVLRLVNPLAACIVVASLVGRAIAPQLRGLVIGTDRLVYRVEQASAFSLQIVAMAAEVIAIAHLLSVSSLRVRAPLRAAAVVVGGAVLFATLAASVRPVPEQTALVVGALGAAVALAGAVVAQRAPFAAPLARAVGTAALGAVARLVALSLALDGVKHQGSARVVATAAVILQAGALVLAMTSVARRARSLIDPGVVVALAVSLLAVRGGLADPSDLGASGTLLRRAGEALVLRPFPALPLAVTFFVAVFTQCLAVACLARKSAFPALTGVAALALAASPSPETPLGALSLLLAGFALVIIANDPRALWAALGAPSPVGDHGPASS